MYSFSRPRLPRSTSSRKSSGRGRAGSGLVGRLDMDQRHAMPRDPFPSRRVPGDGPTDAARDPPMSKLRLVAPGDARTDPSARARPRRWPAWIWQAALAGVLAAGCLAYWWSIDEDRREL